MVGVERRGIVLLREFCSHKLERMQLLANLLSCLLLTISAWVYHQPQSNWAWMSSLMASVFPIFCVIFLILLSWMQSKGNRRSGFFLAMNVLTTCLLLWPVGQFFYRGNDFQKGLELAFPVREQTDFKPSFGKLLLLQDWSESNAPQYKVANRDGDMLSIQVFPAQDTSAPCIFQIHGGGYSKGSYQQLANYARYLNLLGYSVVSTSYRFIPEFQWPAQLEDVIDVYQEVASAPAKYGLQAKEFILSGRSAGAHLALAAGMRLKDARIRGVIAFYPVVDFKLFHEKGYAGDLLDSPTLLNQLLQSTPTTNPQIYADINPVNFITPYAPPVLLLHGDRDSVVPVDHSRIMAEYLTAARVPNYFLQLPYESHGFDINLNGPGGQAASFAVKQFLTSIFEQRK